MRRYAFIVAILAGMTPVALVLSSCSSSNAGGQSGVSSDKIVVAELSAPLGGLSAYEIVMRYNAGWLEQRGPDSFEGQADIQVYVDDTGHPYGSASSLRQIDAAQVESIEYFSDREAQFRFGLGNVAGAILVRTRSGR